MLTTLELTPALGFWIHQQYQNRNNWSIFILTEDIFPNWYILHWLYISLCYIFIAENFNEQHKERTQRKQPAVSTNCSADSGSLCEITSMFEIILLHLLLRTNLSNSLPQALHIIVSFQGSSLNDMIQSHSLTMFVRICYPHQLCQSCCVAAFQHNGHWGPPTWSQWELTYDYNQDLKSVFAHGLQSEMQSFRSIFVPVSGTEK